MGLESASYPNQLVATNPTGSDPKSTADDHIRLLKSVIQTTFPSLTGAMTAAQADLNKVGVTQPQTSNDTSVSSTAFVQTAVASAITAIGAGASMWVSGTTYALGNVVWSPSNYQTYRRIIAGAGTTDPANDATNWVLVSGNVQTTATQTLTNKTLDAPVITGGASISGNVAVAGDLSVSGSGGIRNTHTSAAYSFGPSSTEQIYRSGNTLRFYVNGADVSTLDASGNLLVGTPSAIFGEKLTVSNSSSSSYNIVAVSTSASYTGGGIISGSTATSGSGFRCFTGYSSSGIVFQVLGNGNALNTNNSYGAISDIKLKQDITDATPKLAKLLKVRIVNYKFKADPGGIKQIGVIAQELEEISPGLIEETPDYEEVTLTREVEKTVPVTEKREITTERLQLDVIDGVAVQTVIKETAVIDEPVVDEYPVFDSDGNPVMEAVTPATDAELDDKGNEVKAAMPAVLRQKIHAVPRMETVVEKEEYTERRLTGTTTKSVKYSIFVPMLIKAMQEQQEQIEALKAKVGA